jgi:hypothetical protein
MSWIIVIFLTLVVSGQNEPTVVHLSVPGVSRIAIWRSRAFLSVPALPSSLFEVTWQPSLPSSTRIRRFPVAAVTFKRCNGLQAIADLKTDNFGRLWILDAGTLTCSPKLVIYDLLFYRISEIIKHKFEIGVKLTDFVVDSSQSRSLSVAYLAGDEKLYVYSVYQDRSWFVRSNINGKITGLTLKKGGSYHRTALLIETDNINIFQIFTNNMLESETRAVQLGQLLGPNSAGLISNTEGAVYYTLARDFVALKWDSELPLEAESHEVILQSDALLQHVTYLAVDSSKNVWALVNNGTTKASWCVKLTD